MPVRQPIRFTLVSLGCAKNQVDSEALIAFLEGEGARWVEAPEQADWILVNTCGFIDDAKEESIRTTLELKGRYPDRRVLMFGCLAERYGEELRREMPEIDGFCGTLRSTGLPGFLARLRAGGGEEAAGLPPRRAKAPPAVHRRRLLSYPGSAYVKIAEGCSNRCTYCAIPLIRGGLASRGRPAVVEETRRLLAAGIREINLVAQDLASYGRDRGEGELESLLAELSGLPGRFWLRLLYLHPDHFPPGILPLLARDPRILPYFDIPFQHASPRVLAGMGRRGSAGRYLELLERTREALPGAVFRSTFLVGFPGEEEEDFHRLLDFQQEARLDWAGVFVYSREEGTPAAGLEGRVPAAVARRRARLLQEAQQPISEARLDRRVGETVEVLVEEEFREGAEAGGSARRAPGARAEGAGGGRRGPAGRGAGSGAQRAAAACDARGRRLYLARAWFQAPEVDGLVVLWAPERGAAAPRPGATVEARLLRRNGLDLEAVALGERFGGSRGESRGESRRPGEGPEGSRR